MILKDRGLLYPDGTPPVELIRKCIEQHGRKLPRLNRLNDYVDGEHDILKRRLAPELPNNRLVANHAEYISTIATGYVHGTPVSYSGPGADMLDTIFTKNDEDCHNSELGMNNSVFGSSYEVIYMTMDEETYPAMSSLDPRNTELVCDTTVQHDPMFGFQYSPELDLNDTVTGYIIVVYSKYFIQHYRAKTLTGNDYVLLIQEEHYFNDVPLIEYQNGKRAKGDFETVLPLIDAYNLLQSERVNDKEQLADALLAIQGAELGDEFEERSQTAKLIRQEKILELPADGKAYWVVKTLNETEIEVLKKALKDDIHEFSFVPCLTDENFVGNSSGVAMRYKLLGLEMKGQDKERFFKKGLKRRLKIICNILSIMAVTVDPSSIDIVMKRTLPVDNEALLKMVQETEDFLSWETRLKRFDPEIDIEEEKERLLKEEREKIEQKQKAFGSYDFKHLGNSEI